jgi:hypothetical protein
MGSQAIQKTQELSQWEDKNPSINTSLSKALKVTVTWTREMKESCGFP